MPVYLPADTGDRPSRGSALRGDRRRCPGHARVRHPVPHVGRPVASRRHEGGGRIDRDRRRRRGRGTTRSRSTARDPRPKAARRAGEPLWIVLIGHGTYDGREAKFNLRGPDVTDVELAKWLAPVKRPVVVIDCASASGPFLNRLSGAEPDRHHGDQERQRDELRPVRPVPRRGDRRPAGRPRQGRPGLAPGGLSDSPASRVDEYYRTHSQLATEHALLDDNGDRLGTPADWFRGVRATRRAKDGAPLDGIRAHQLHLIPSDRERRHPGRDPPAPRRARAGRRRPPRPEGQARRRTNITRGSSRSWSSWDASINRPKPPRQRPPHDRGNSRPLTSPLRPVGHTRPNCPIRGRLRENFISVNNLRTQGPFLLIIQV